MHIKSSRKIRLKDIAQTAGVATATVSAALNDTGRISDALREKILQVSHEMNYEPNLAAKLLKQKNRTDIGLIASELPDRMIGSGFFQPMIVTFIQQCEQEGLKGQIEYHNLEKEDNVPALLTNGFVGGALHGGYISRGIRRWLDQHPEFPFVSLEEPSEYSLITRFDRTIYNAVQHLAALGHKRIGLVVGPQQYDMQKQFKLGFDRAVSDFGIDTNCGKWIATLKMENDPTTTQDGVEWGTRTFAAKDRPSALISGGPAVTRGIIYAALKAGLDIPTDFSIITCTSQSESEQTYPALTSITWNHKEAVNKGLHMLRNLMEQRSVAEKNIIIEPDLVMRNTVAKYRN